MDRLELGYAARDAAAATLADSGGTFDRVTLAPRMAHDGYAVGGILPGLRLHRDAHLAAAILQYADDMAGRIPGGYIGTWIDGAIVYVDAVVILPDLASALTLAAALGERAVYAFADGATVEVAA